MNYQTIIFSQISLHKKLLRRSSAFTLVELIVVITILAILGTIGFRYIQGYSLNSRNSVRVENTHIAAKNIELAILEKGSIPIPDANVLTIHASGAITGYQGYLGNTVSDFIKVNEIRDPSDQSKLTLATNKNRTKYQVATYLETTGNLLGNTGIEDAYAAGNGSTHQITTQGNPIGIFMAGTGSNTHPAQELYLAASFTGIDLIQTTTASGYTVEFGNGVSSTDIPTTGTGAYTGSLFTFVYNARSDLLTDTSLAINDPSLVGYWDMETTIQSGATVLLKDLSGYGNHLNIIGNTVPGSGINGKYRGVACNQTGTGYFELPGFGNHINKNEITMVVRYEKTSPYENAYQKLAIIGSDSGGSFLAGLSQGPNAYPFYPVIQTESGFVGGGHDARPALLQPHHDVFTQNATNVFRMWSDGTEILNRYGADQGYISSGTITAKNSPMRICYGYGNEYFVGNIYEVRVYNRALTEMEVLALYPVGN